MVLIGIIGLNKHAYEEIENLMFELIKHKQLNLEIVKKMQLNRVLIEIIGFNKLAYEEIAQCSFVFYSLRNFGKQREDALVVVA